MPVGQATMLYFSYPVFVIIIMTLLFKEKLDSRKCLALSLSVTGILFLIGFKVDLKTPGFFLALGSGLAYATYLTALQKSQLRLLSSQVIVFYLGCFSSLFFGIQNLFNPISLPSVENFVLLFLLGVITVFVLLMVNYAIQSIGSADTSLIIALEAVVTLVFGIVIFHESFTFLTLIGAVLMLLSSITISLSARHPSTNE
ncbi:DMT family transporter [Eubacteriaceae bacterium ES2]|nr:DMT family transporter [Eubacteriaceae bacterium ES2]